MTLLIHIRQYLCDGTGCVQVEHIDICILAKAQQELDLITFYELLLITEMRGQFQRYRSQPLANSCASVVVRCTTPTQGKDQQAAGKYLVHQTGLCCRLESKTVVISEK